MYELTMVVNTGERVTMEFKNRSAGVDGAWKAIESGFYHQPPEQDDLTVFYPPHRIYQVELKRMASE